MNNEQSLHCEFPTLNPVQLRLTPMGGEATLTKEDIQELANGTSVRFRIVGIPVSFPTDLAREALLEHTSRTLC